MNIELRHLRYFIAVAEELHFGRAAARLNISQPPLSQQIQILEQQIGARLFARTNRSVSLTAAGRQFLADSRHILSLVDDAAARASRLHHGETGELHIGFTSSAPFIKAVSDTLSTFRRRYPDVHIQTRETNTREQIVPLNEGALDLGLMRRYGQTPMIAQEVGEAMTIIGLVASGLGVSILPASFKRVQLNEMRWLPIKEQDAVSEMWLVWSKHHEQSQAAQRFREYLLAAAAVNN
ncbi:TPA: LysR family transcriptional regulator [Raoultella ornithinolytica]